MFKKSTYSIGSHQILVIKNESGAGIELIPGLGGAIKQVFLTNKAIPLFDSFVDDNDLNHNPSYKQSILFPFPNRMRDGRYSFEGKIYQFPINEKSRGNALHGFLSTLPMKVSEVTMAGNNSMVKLNYDYKGEYEYYPFPCSLELVYEITNLSLSIHFEIKNVGPSNLLYGYGWHPYFKSDDVLKLEVPEGKVQVVDQRNLPTGEEIESPLDPVFSELNQTLDTCFKLKDNSMFNANVGFFKGVKVLLKADASFRYYQIYTPKPNIVAVEPVTSNIDAFNTLKDVIILPPGTSNSHQIHLSIG